MPVKVPEPTKKVNEVIAAVESHAPEASSMFPAPTPPAVLLFEPEIAFIVLFLFVFA